MRWLAKANRRQLPTVCAQSQPPQSAPPTTLFSLGRVLASSSQRTESPDVSPSGHAQKPAPLPLVTGEEQIDDTSEK